MMNHQEEYLKLIAEKFGIKGTPKRATYKRWGDTWDSGIIVELEVSKSNLRLVFLSDTPRKYFHKWSMELPSEHLTPCVWITMYTDKDLSFIKGFYI